MVLTVINPMPQLAMNILIVALIVLVVVPGPTRRLRLMTACALFLVAGTLYFHRRPAKPPAPPPAPAALAVSKLPSLEDLDLDVSVKGVPHVRFKDGCLVVEGLTRPTETPDSTAQPTTEAAPEGLPLVANLRSEIAAELAHCFDGLVQESAPRSRQLRELRTALKNLSAEQRRYVADEAARVRAALTEPDGPDAGSQFTMKPDDIIRLARARLPKAPPEAEGPGWVGALATIAVLLAASSVLKRVAAPADVRRA